MAKKDSTAAIALALLGGFSGGFAQGRDRQQLRDMEKERMDLEKEYQKAQMAHLALLDKASQLQYDRDIADGTPEEVAAQRKAQRDAVLEKTKAETSLSKSEASFFDKYKGKQAQSDLDTAAANRDRIKAETESVQKETAYRYGPADSPGPGSIPGMVGRNVSAMRTTPTDTATQPQEGDGVVRGVTGNFDVDVSRLTPMDIDKLKLPLAAELERGLETMRLQGASDQEMQAVQKAKLQLLMGRPTPQDIQAALSFAQKMGGLRPNKIDPNEVDKDLSNADEMIGKMLVPVTGSVSKDKQKLYGAALQDLRNIRMQLRIGSITPEQARENLRRNPNIQQSFGIPGDTSQPTPPVPQDDGTAQPAPRMLDSAVAGLGSALFGKQDPLTGVQQSPSLFSRMFSFDPSTLALGLGVAQNPYGQRPMPNAQMGAPTGDEIYRALMQGFGG